MAINLTFYRKITVFNTYIIKHRSENKIKIILKFKKQIS